MKFLGIILIIFIIWSTSLSARADDVSPTTSPSANPTTISKCEVVKMNGPNAFIQCVDSFGNVIPAGQVDLPSVIKSIFVDVPGPTITLPPLPRATKTITNNVSIPGPTHFVTLRPETIFLPSSPLTRFIKVPGPVVTKTPAPITLTVTTSSKPVIINKVIPQVDKPQNHDVWFDLPPVSTPKAVGYSAIGLIILCGLILLGLWMGYILGYKDKEREERKFLAALRDRFYYKGEHS